MPQELRDLQRRCIDCAQPFVIAKLEIAFYLDKHFHIPRRCSACRAAKRARAVENAPLDAPAGRVG